MAELGEDAISQIQSGLSRLATIERRVSALESSLPSNVANQAQQPLLGKPTADIEEGEFGEFEIYSRGDGTKGAEVATGIMLANVFMRSGDALAAAASEAGDLCYILYVDGGLEASRAVC